MSGELCGPFHFAGYGMDLALGQRAAEQMNDLNWNGLHPDVTWTANRNSAGLVSVCARTDSQEEAEAVGNALGEGGILSHYIIIAAKPNPFQTALGKKPYFIISADLTDINRPRLDEIDRQAAIAEEAEDDQATMEYKIHSLH